MRPLLRTALAVAVPLALAACSDSPAAPQPTPVDRLNALADSLGAGDPMSEFVRQGAVLLAQTPRTATVTIEVDGTPESFQAAAFETVLPPMPAQRCPTSTGADCSLPAGGGFDSKVLFGWDAAMQHFVQLSVVTSEFAAGTPFTNAVGIYAARGPRGQRGTTFLGVATATGTRASTGASCPSRRPAADSFATCVEAAYDFAFAFDGRPFDANQSFLFAPMAPIAPSPSAPVAHTLRMASTRVPGALLTVKSLPIVAASVTVR